jgi:hypothetical protein
LLQAGIGFGKPVIGFRQFSKRRRSIAFLHGASFFSWVRRRPARCFKGGRRALLKWENSRILAASPLSQEVSPRLTAIAQRSFSVRNVERRADRTPEHAPDDGLIDGPEKTKTP